VSWVEGKGSSLITTMKAKPSRRSASKSSPSTADRTLPIGICETRFYNPEHRETKDPKKARACFYAYIGGKKNYKAKRFMIDTLGRDKALREAKKWRREQERELAAGGQPAASEIRTAAPRKKSAAAQPKAPSRAASRTSTRSTSRAKAK
jgi:hypothetical protein